MMVPAPVHGLTLPQCVRRWTHPPAPGMRGWGRASGAFCLALTLALPALAAHASAGTIGGRWTTTERMIHARQNHTATLLPDGTVLVAGGNGSQYVPGMGWFLPIASAELYHPATGTWSQTGSLAIAREGATATLLKDGQVLVAGGVDCTPSSCTNVAGAELYDPSTGTWTPTGNMVVAMGGQEGATLLPNGQVLVVGGCCDATGNSFANAELYDPNSGQWHPTASMHYPRSGAPATLLPNGKVLVAAGWTLTGDQTSAEVYDPGTGTWTLTGDLHVGRDNHTATLLPDGKVLVAGGFTSYGTGNIYTTSAELYDPGTGTWTTTGSLHIGRVGHTATLLSDGEVLVVGGNVIHSAGVTASAELYNPASATWRLTSPMAVGRAVHTATLLSSGQVLVAGGNGNNLRHEILASAELYTP